jgi:hypothetical protein
MRKLLEKLGTPMFGNVEIKKDPADNKELQDTLAAIRRKKAANPTLKVTEEIRKVLEKFLT